jgi:hypothetical protein
MSVELRSYTPSVEEYSKVCQLLVFYPEIAGFLSLDHEESPIWHRELLRKCGLDCLYDELGGIQPWFMRNVGTDNDDVRAFFFAVSICRQFTRSQPHRCIAPLSPVPASRAPDIEKGKSTASVEELVAHVARHARSMEVGWRPLNPGGGNMQCSLLTLVWIIRQYGSVTISRACPGDFRILSLYTGTGTVYRSLGVSLPHAIVPTSKDDVVRIFLDPAGRPIGEDSDWAGHAPASHFMHLGRQALLIIVVGFFVTLVSGSSSWLSLSRCVGVLPPPPNAEVQGKEELPWARLSVTGLAQCVGDTWFIGTNSLKPYGGYYVPPPFPIMALGIAGSFTARAHL